MTDTTPPPFGSYAKKAQARNQESYLSTGQKIMSYSEVIYKHLLPEYSKCRDAEGKLFQPAHIRGFALNMAQYLVKNEATA